jgi:hypothetical protein
VIILTEHINTSMEQKKNPQNGLYKYTYLIIVKRKGQIKFNGERIIFSINFAGTTRHPHEIKLT